MNWTIKFQLRVSYRISCLSCLHPYSLTSKSVGSKLSQQFYMATTHFSFLVPTLTVEGSTQKNLGWRGPLPLLVNLLIHEPLHTLCSHLDGGGGRENGWKGWTSGHRLALRHSVCVCVHACIHLCSVHILYVVLFLLLFEEFAPWSAPSSPPQGQESGPPSKTVHPWNRQGIKVSVVLTCCCSALAPSVAGTDP